MMKNDSRFEVHLTRSSPAGVANSKRPQISNKFNSDCFLSIHLNFWESPSAHGTETEVNKSGKGKTSQGMGNIEYAKIIQKYMQRATGFTDRGLTDRAHLAVLNNNKAAAALAEIGFLSNPTEAKALKKNKKKYAKSFYDAFIYIATKYPKPTVKGNVTEASSSKLNSSLTSNVTLKNVSKAEKTVKKGKYRKIDGKHSNGIYSVAGRKYTMYAQSKGTSSWCHSHGCSASVLATMLSSAGYSYTADQIHSAGADKDYSVKAAIKSHGIKNGTNSDYDAFNNNKPFELENDEKLKTLIRSFRERAYKNFSSVVFCRLSNKFISRFYYGQNSFYKILYSFIPVFIYYPHLYNPIFDNPDTSIKHLQLYKLAVEKNRVSGKPDGLHAYMLTHEEICRACGMTHFMRFTPSFFYELLVGLLNPSLDTFPSVNNKIFVKPDVVDSSLGNKLPRCYSRINYIFELQKCNEQKNDPVAQHKFDILRQYVEKDSLYYCCERNLKNLFNYGPNVIDPPKITVDTVYAYLQEMRLL